ncbi:histidine protein kinase NIK1 [Acrasis kona]|uniref:Histidine protein kinase NIK1 n=1 Tax=Acrasis kona TaxID=1008807 RepID=A0AAW2Z1D5_9EUKA
MQATPKPSSRQRVEYDDDDDGTFNVWYFSVVDFGIGIQADKLHLLFQPFSQVNPVGTNFGGTGLGLTICKKIMNAMSGEIHVHSTFGHGTTFTVEVPLGNSVAKETTSRNLGLGPQHKSLVCDGFQVIILTKYTNLGECISKWYRDVMSAKMVDVGSNPKLEDSHWRSQIIKYDMVVIDADFLSECEILFQVPMKRVLLFGAHNEKAMGELNELDCVCVEAVMKPCKLTSFVNQTRSLVDTFNLRGNMRMFPRNKLRKRKSFDVTKIQTNPVPANQEREDFNVLIVDDNQIGQRVAMACLDRANVRYSVSANGLDALKKLTGGDGSRYDMVVMDNYMPEMTGVECARKIREFEECDANGHRHFIVGLSGTTNRSEMDEMMSVVDEYFMKPLSSALLVDLVRTRIQAKKKAALL